LNTVAIVGVGLLGRSLALALRRARFKGTIIGVSRTPRQLGPEFNLAATLEQAAPVADVVVLCAPVLAIIADIKRLGTMVRPGTLVTDVGSTKRAILDTAHEHLHGAVFLGGHPMAGKQVGGMEHAEAGLYSGKTWFLVRSVEPDPPVVAEFVSWIKRIRAKPMFIGAEDHDRSVALTSHLAQVLSTSLAATVADSDLADKARDRSGPGLRDMLRLAESGYDMWHDILATNGDLVAEAVGRFAATLDQFAQPGQYSRCGHLFDRASAFAREIRKKAK
jgi:prephenate dehydrogenase